MEDDLRARRSALYLPGNNPRALTKARTLPADVLIFDLEDAVGPEAKNDARARVCEEITSRDYQQREIVVRINSLGTQWHDDDLAAVARSTANGVLVPKVESGQEVRALADALAEQNAPARLMLWAMIETPRAFLNVADIASASDRLAALVVGTNDLVNDLHGLHVPGREPILPALSLAVLAARAAGKVVLDGVFNAISDAVGFAAEARQGRAMGFDGKTVIHPSQIGAANNVFGPSHEEVTHAQTVVSAYEAAQAAGDSVIVVDGRMIESLHVRDAERVLALSTLIRELENPTHAVP